jgi:hypothetical protein
MRALGQYLSDQIYYSIIYKDLIRIMYIEYCFNLLVKTTIMKSDVIMIKLHTNLRGDLFFQLVYLLNSEIVH